MTCFMFFVFFVVEVWGFVRDSKSYCAFFMVYG